MYNSILTMSWWLTGLRPTIRSVRIKSPMPTLSQRIISLTHTPSRMSQCWWPLKLSSQSLASANDPRTREWLRPQANTIECRSSEKWCWASSSKTQTLLRMIRWTSHHHLNSKPSSSTLISSRSMDKSSWRTKKALILVKIGMWTRRPGMEISHQGLTTQPSN